MDPKSIFRTLKEASSFDIFLISFLLLPFVIHAWIGILTQMGFNETTEISLGVGLVILAYIIGIGLMYTGSTQARKREVARDEIVSYLKSKGYEIMSFDRVRKNINASYTDEFLLSAIQAFPNHIRRAKLHGSKPGVGRIIEVETNQDDEG